MTVIRLTELFGGIGAPRKALENLGYDIESVNYVEIDNKAVKTYNALYNENYEPQDISQVFDIGETDILVHGSPCQDFSVAGLGLGANPEDRTRSSLMFETLRIVDDTGDKKPEFVIWENVKGALHKKMRPYFDKYLSSLEDMGYTNSYRVLNSLDFGVPQNRERVYVVSSLGGQSFDFDKIKTKQTRPLNEFIEADVDDIYRVQSPARVRRLPGGADDGVVEKSLMFRVIDTHTWTIMTNQTGIPNSGIVDMKNGHYRYLTERESWRLMGFTDEDYDKALSVNPTMRNKKNPTLYKQAGNSIVVPVLESIFETLLNN